jgi:adenine-specific DNA methylase
MGQMIEKNFDISFTADLALREKQIQQNYRPVIAVHKWFARRPGTLFRSLLLSEFTSGTQREIFYQSHDLAGKRIADPFMGGGTPLLEANRLGCNVLGYDINAMSHWIVREEIENIDLTEYRKAAENVLIDLETKLGSLYRTQCLLCGSTTSPAKHFLWVKTQVCSRCGHDVDLFPGYLLAEDRRHPKNVLVCAACGELSECPDRHAPGSCTSCGAPLTLAGPAKRGSCQCPNCANKVTYPQPELGSPRHRMFAIEYHCFKCKGQHLGRFFKKPDARDLAKFGEAEVAKDRLDPKFVPTEAIPDGDETDRLHRWGYQFYSEMFNSRQLVGLEFICRLIGNHRSERIRHALATNLSDLLRYQNMLCRYDTMALKSLDIFSVHGFPVGLVECESNLLGIVDKDKGTNVGSGGWSNIIEKYVRAKTYCDHPFEIRHFRGSKTRVPIHGEWIGKSKKGATATALREIDLRCGDAASAELLPGSLDAVFTDPPYFGNVQYAELMDFCYVWLRRIINNHSPFGEASTRNTGELTGNINMSRGLEHFAVGLAAVFQKMAIALKPGAPLAFTYHHNQLDAYYPIAAAILDAGFTCSASLPCPGEMGASIHISGTDSSIIDTVFVCRLHGVTQRHLLADDPDSIAALVDEDVRKLREGGVRIGIGDIRCLTRGHLIRIAIWHLHRNWDKTVTTAAKLSAVSNEIERLGGTRAIERSVLRVPTLNVRVASTALNFTANE